MQYVNLTSPNKLSFMASNFHFWKHQQTCESESVCVCVSLLKLFYFNLFIFKLNTLMCMHVRGIELVSRQGKIENKNELRWIYNSHYNDYNKLSENDSQFLINF